VAGSITVPLFAGTPGIFLEPQGDAAAVNQDGSVNSAAQPAPAGSVIAAYLTGLGKVSPAVASGSAAPASPLSTVSAVTASIGGVPAKVSFAGLAPGFAGLYQINVEVPALASGHYDLRISVQGSGSNAAPISIR
jgi:adhesin/invasin